jgi:glycosyltransferase involved in cell wall biosynthesis
MRVALVHEFLTQSGGAERVLEVFHELFPNAPVYTLVHDKWRTRGQFGDLRIHTSFLQNLPGMPGKYKWYLPLMPRAIESFDFSGFDLVLSDASAFAKGVTVKKPAVHICYCHTPTRYLWQDMDSYVASGAYPGIIKKMVKVYLKEHLRPWDYAAAQRPDVIVANSQTVRARIKKYYGRDSVVIYPPVDTDFFKPSSAKKDFFLVGSRLEPYKKIDLVIDAFNDLGWPLKVVGTGTAAPILRQRAGPNIEFLGKVPDAQLRELYSQARAFVLPALEDAGLMVPESLACGTPVIGFAEGGTVEYLTDGENGVLFAEQTPGSIAEALRRFVLLKFDEQKVRQSVLRFDKAQFKTQILELIKTHARGH